MTKITILDGGMGRELERIGAPFRQPEWSALALMEAPDMVTQAHMNFIEAGAEIITTNAYAVIPHHIGEERFHNEGRELIKQAVKCAKEAVDSGLRRNDGDKNIKIAGCIPPLFGSYLPDQFDESQVDPILTPFIEEQEEHIDFWIVETISSTQEAVTISQKLKAMTDKPIWLSFTIMEQPDPNKTVTLRHGNYIDQAIKEVVNHVIPDAILFNCCAPDIVTDALNLAKSITTTIPLGAYANNFVNNNNKGKEGSNKVITELDTSVTPAVYTDYAKTWVDAGANILGGCCGIGPDHIKELTKSFKNHI
jgi:S-methylmethionine-dependent homocysteine/selenocysteine methylase